MRSREPTSDFLQRSQEVEIMDDLQCSGEVVHQTLRELEFINKWLGGNAITLEGVRQLIRGHKNRTITIADLGCGSGDILRLLANWGRKNNIPMRFTGIDANPHIIAFARKHSEAYPEIYFESLDIFSPDFQQRQFDIILGTLFYHHFQSEVLIEFFSKLKTQALIGWVINDLHRHWVAFHSIRLVTKYFSKSSMVQYDAPLSVLRAFSREELEDILSKAGILKYNLKWKWAFRWQVVAT